MTKFAVALVFFVVIGLQLTSAKLSRPMQKSKSEAIEYHESEGDDKKLYLSSIDEKDVSTLIDGIKTKKDTGALYSAGRQFAVLCYVPRGKGLSYNTLTKKGVCDWRAPDPRNNNNHAEQILLQNAFKVLRQNYNAEYKTLQYDILLYTYNSPCPTCAGEIVNTLSEARDAFELRVAYHQRYIWRNAIPPDPDGSRLLQQTTNIFNNFNKNTAGQRKTPSISLKQYD